MNIKRPFELLMKVKIINLFSKRNVKKFERHQKLRFLKETI